MRTIAVGVDLSEESERAVAHAVAIARHAGAGATLILVDDVPDLADVALGACIDLRRADRLEEHRRALGALRQRWSGRGPALSQLVVDGRPADRLPEVAAELAAELIVVGSHGRTGVKRFLIGSVAERVTRYADRSVLVARGDAPDGGYHRVVVGTDLGTQLETLVRQVLPLLARDARLELVHCWQMPWTGALGEAVAFVPYAELQRALEDAMRGVTDTVRALLHERPDVRLEPHLVLASPAVGLVDTAGARGADLVVVGTHGRRGVRRFALGSVAEVTLRHARCAVLVAR